MSAAAERYAQAIFELGVEEGNLRALSEGLSSLAAAMKQSRELTLVLSDPTVDQVERAELLTALTAKIGLPDVGRRSVQVLAERGRIAALPAVAERVAQLADAHEGVVEAQVTTAEELSDSFYRSLERALAEATGKKVRLARAVDPDLIGGAITRIGDATIDASVRGRLASLERELTEALVS